MGFDIFIGEWAKGVGDEERPISQVEQEHAPAFEHDDLTGRTNRRQPSYTSWTAFCKRTKVHALFFDRERGLMREHPFTSRLETAHLDEVRAALRAHRAAKPGAVPGWCGGQDEDLARLVWLEWWMNWALSNSKRPAIHNR